MNKLFLSLVLLPALAPLASANTLIDTTPGTSQVNPFGVFDTATYGQTVTVPADNVLQSFSFGMDLPGSLQFKGYVYEWDSINGHATGPQLFSSPTTQTAGTGMQQVTFTVPGGVSLTTGSQYVLFASISEIDGQSQATGPWAWHQGDVYAGGEFVFYNNGADESLWTSTTWDSFIHGTDLAFTADFGSSGAVPEVQTWASLAGVAMVGAEALRRRKAAKA